MTNNWAIVAIPEKNDSVWKYSSEKVPHMTILSLGEHEEGPLAAKILSYLEHACDVMLHKFGMYSDERTELGPKKADVVLFEHGGRSDRQIVEFRDALLKDPDVLEWFNTSPQFKEWTPHLTLGFPETPAPPDNRDYPGIHSVHFDRIALWTGDYDGPEIKLKAYAPQDMDLMMSDLVASLDLSQKVGSSDVLHRPDIPFDESKVHRKGGKFAPKAIGDSASKTQYQGSRAVQKLLRQEGSIRKSRVTVKHDDIPGIHLGKTMGEMEIKPNLDLMHYLEHHDMELVMLNGAEWVAVTDAVHFGRKGMKWGVRHKRGSDGKVTDSISSDAQQAAALKAKLASGGTHALTNEELTTLKKRISLENDYAKATGTDKSALDRRHEKVKKAVDLGKTANDLYKFYHSDVGKILRSLAGQDVPDDAPSEGGDKKKDSSDNSSGKSGKKSKKARSPSPTTVRLLYDATRLGRRSPGFSSPYKTQGNPFIKPASKRRTRRGTVYGVTDLK